MSVKHCFISKNKIKFNISNFHKLVLFIHKYELNYIEIFVSLKIVKFLFLKITFRKMPNHPSLIRIQSDTFLSHGVKIWFTHKFTSLVLLQFL